MLQALGLSLPTIPAILVPVLIFFARICDVSLGTIRIILVARGLRVYATVLGFLEVFIWLTAISQIMQNLSSWHNFIAYSAGFAAGTFVGMTIERRLSIGSLMIRMIVPNDSSSLIDQLIANGHRLTHVDAQGSMGSVKIVFTVVKRRALRDVVQTIKEFDPNTFYTVEDVRVAKHPVAPRPEGGFKSYLMQPFIFFRKGK